MLQYIFRMSQGVVQIGEFSYFPSQVAGKGATALVYQGYRNQDRMRVAVKTIRLSEVNTAVKKHLLDCEVSALKTIRHKHVCHVFDVMKDQEFYFVPMELCPNGTLRDYIKSKHHLSQSEALSMFSKILKGYCAIRSAGFVHRDLKTQNILLRSNLEPVIIDFGFCQTVSTQNQKLPYNVGSPAYMAPEAYNDSCYSQKSDVWALGVILHQMLTGTIPVMRTTDINHYFQYLRTMKTAEIIPGNQNSLCTQLLLNALIVDSYARPNAEQLLAILEGQENYSPPRRRISSVNQDFSLHRFKDSQYSQKRHSYVNSDASMNPMSRPQSQVEIPLGFPFSTKKASEKNSLSTQDNSLFHHQNSLKNIFVPHPGQQTFIPFSEPSYQMKTVSHHEVYLNRHSSYPEKQSLNSKKELPLSSSQNYFQNRVFMNPRFI